LITQRDECGSSFGILPKIPRQYSTFSVTQDHLQLAVKKIDSDMQLPSELFPTSQIASHEPSLPTSLLTGHEESTSTITMTRRSKGGRPAGSTIKAQNEHTKKIKSVIVEASASVLDAQKEKTGTRPKHNKLNIMLRRAEEEHRLELQTLDSHVSAIKSRVYRSKNPSGLAESQKLPLSELDCNIIWKRKLQKERQSQSVLPKRRHAKEKRKELGIDPEVDLGSN